MICIAYFWSIEQNYLKCRGFWWISYSLHKFPNQKFAFCDWRIEKMLFMTEIIFSHIKKFENWWYIYSEQKQGPQLKNKIKKIFCINSSYGRCWTYSFLIYWYLIQFIYFFHVDFCMGTFKANIFKAIKIKSYWMMKNCSKNSEL